VAEIEVDEMLGLVGYEAAEISTDYTMPSGTFSFVELWACLLVLFVLE
jgi:hypothetical protein